MATQPATFTDVAGDGSCVVAKWVLTATDDGAPLSFAQWADKSIQIGTTGDTFNAGTVILEGSNDGIVWTQLHDPSSTVIAGTANTLKQVLEMTAYIRPRASVSVTSVTCLLAVRRQQPLRV
jgi:hypothetical protein